jgi:RES domain
MSSACIYYSLFKTEIGDRQRTGTEANVQRPTRLRNCYGAAGVQPAFAVDGLCRGERPTPNVEFQKGLAADFELVPDDLKPRVTCGIEWELSSVLDLTIASLPARLKLSDWMRENFTKINDRGFETLCQAFGRAVRNSGISGILYPSVRVKDGINLVVFRDRMRKTEVAR